MWGLGDTADAVPVEYEGTGVIPTEGLYDSITNWDIRGKFGNGAAFKFTDGGDLTTFVGEKGRIGTSRGGLREVEPASLRDERLGPGERRLIVSVDHGQNFLDGIKNRGGNTSPIDVAFLSDSISHLSDIAIRLGRKIRWDPKREEIGGDPSATRLLQRPLRAPWRL